MFPAHTSTRPDVGTTSSSLANGAGESYAMLRTYKRDIRIGPDERAGHVQTNRGNVVVEAGSRVASITNVNGDVVLSESVCAGRLSAGRSCLLTRHACVSGDLECGGKAAIIGTDCRIDGNLVSKECAVVSAPRSRIAGHVEMHDSALRLMRSEVGGNITGVRSDLIVGADSRVAGGIDLHGPVEADAQQMASHVEIGPGAQVAGALRFIGRVTLYIHDTARTGDIAGAVPVAFSTPNALQ